MDNIPLYARYIGWPEIILIAVIGLGLIIGLAVYAFVCYCLKRICLKAGHEPGAIIWIPIAQFVPMLTVAELPLWWIILLLIPCVNIFVIFYVWHKILERLGHGAGFLIGIIFLPFIFIPLLAFDQSPNQVEQAQ